MTEYKANLCIDIPVTYCNGAEALQCNGGVTHE